MICATVTKAPKKRRSKVILAALIGISLNFAMQLPALVYALPPSVAGEGKFVAINLNGVVIQNGHDVSITSAPFTIGPSNHYRFDITGVAHGTGLLGSRIPAGTQLTSAFDQIAAGTGAALRGYVFESSFSDNYPILNKTVNGGFSGVFSVSGTIASSVSHGIGSFDLQSFSVRLLGSPDNNDTIVIDEAHLLGQSMDINKSDFNFDAYSDLVIFDSKKKQTKIGYLKDTSWSLGNAKKSIITALSGAKLPAGFSIVGTSDFNLDGNLDLLLFNPKTRATEALTMNIEKSSGATVAASILQGPTLPSGFKVGGISDFDLDGIFDLLIYNQAKHQTAVVFLQKGMGPLASSYEASTQAGPALPAGFIVTGCSDLNDDGKADLLLFNPKTRATQAIFLNGLVAAGTQNGPKLPTGFSLVGSSGFDNNRSIDLAIFNAKSRQVKFYLATGDTFATLPSKPGHTLTLPENHKLVAPQ